MKNDLGYSIWFKAKDVAGITILFPLDAIKAFRFYEDTAPGKTDTVVLGVITFYLLRESALALRDALEAQAQFLP